jgi:TctA family transporter
VSPLLARWSLSFGPPETFALMLLGLAAAAGFSALSFWLAQRLDR